MTVTTDSIWFRRYPSAAPPLRRLVILPHAGGTPAFYHAWGHAFGDRTEVLVARYPGRQERIAEPCVDRMEPLADHITAALLPFADVPLALFGHSMGASLAYEVALRLENTQGLRPQGLYVSARPAPHRVVPRTTHLKTDDDLLAEVRALGGIADPEVLDHPELRELILPALRADYRVVGTYRPRPPVPVGCPVAAYAGTRDTTASLDAVRAWADVAPAGFHLEVLPGDHFYLVGRREQVIRDLAGRLA